MASKNTPTAIVSGAYWAASFFEKLSSALVSHGWDNKQIHSLVTQQGEKYMKCGVAAFVDAITTATSNLTDFFQTRKGLWSSNEFKKRILAPASEGQSLIPAEVGRCFDLLQNMTDAEIQKELGEGCVFEDTRALLIYLADALKHQWDKEEGPLLVNGSANIFYVRGIGNEVFAAYIYWDSMRRRWLVHACRLDGIQWSRGGRAFSSTAELGD